MPTPPPSPVVHLTAEIESAATDWVTRKDAGLSPAEERAFAEWFSADGRHARAYDRAAAAWAVFDRAQQSGAAADILEGLATRARRRRQRRLQAATAAAFVLCAAWFFPWGREAAPRGEGSATPGLPAGASQLANRNDVRRLPDGSVVELKPGAEIAVNYEAAARHVRLVKGEAFFRVAKDPARPFLVETNGIEVRAVGTAFSVQVQPGAIEVFVKEGAVDVGDRKSVV